MPQKFWERLREQSVTGRERRGGGIPIRTQPGRTLEELAARGSGNVELLDLVASHPRALSGRWRRSRRTFRRGCGDGWRRTSTQAAGC